MEAFKKQAKRALAVAVCDHYHHVRRCMEAETAAGDKDGEGRGGDGVGGESEGREGVGSRSVKPNVLLLGPSGTGKTHLVRSLAKLLSVPFARADATRFSATGYVGADVDDALRSLVPAADGDVRWAEYGIVYFDEVDKLSDAGGSGAAGGGVNTRAVQSSLLKLMEDAEVPLTPPNAPPTQQTPGRVSPIPLGGAAATPPSTLSTRNILFIFSGAFGGLERGLMREHALKAASQKDAASLRDAVGEGSEEHPAGEEGALGLVDSEAGMLASASTADFVRYGFEAEFIGRIPVRVALEQLTTSDLVRVLAEAEGSVLAQMKEDFRGYGIELELTEGALNEVARQAAAQATGARGLLTVLESTLRDFKFELPSTKLKRLTICEETVREPQRHLEALLRQVEREHAAK